MGKTSFPYRFFSQGRIWPGESGTEDTRSRECGESMRFSDKAYSSSFFAIDLEMNGENIVFEVSLWNALCGRETMEKQFMSF